LLARGAILTYSFTEYKTNQIGTGTPNAAALPFIKPEIKTLAALFPDATTQARLEPLKDLNSRQRRALNKLWTEIKLR
ncbi:MAG: hypothetical protein E7H04_21330, partial [Pseudomonas aeruginosa]|nr:hypothetical protein [Pseudomonas aeruginosa]